MKRWMTVGLKGLIGSVLLMAFASASAAEFDPAPMRVVVSVRKFTADDKPSYHHLDLYAGDGKRVRQLTDTSGAHDFNPQFSPDGKQMIFLRNAPGVRDAALDGLWRIDDLEHPHPVKLADTEAPPTWYRSPNELLERQRKSGSAADDPQKGIPSTRSWPSPDGRCVLDAHYGWPTEKERTDDRGMDGDVTFWLRDPATSTTQRLSTLPGYDGLTAPQMIGDSPLLVRPPLAAAFFDRHVGSTDGTVKIALDLGGRRLIELAHSGGRVIPLPGEAPAFFCVCEERYQALGDGRRTVNCMHLDLWNAEFKRTRFAPAIGDFGGAAVLLPGQPPLTIPIEYAPDK